MLVAGDGRYFCSDAIKKIVAIAAGNGVGRVWIGRCTLIRIFVLPEHPWSFHLFSVSMPP